MTKNKKGKLNIFTSYTPGAGKTYKMLVEAAKHSGVVYVAFVYEKHRKNTELLDRLGLKHRITTKYSARKIIEAGVDAVVLDEIGMYSRNIDRIKKTSHGKRNLSRKDFAMDKEWFIYDDIDLFLEAGIDVYCSVNLKRFQSANDVFSELSGIRVKKKVPDRFLDEADSICFIDREPAKLIEDFNNNNLFGEKYMSSRIMKKNFMPETLEQYRKVAMEYIKKYGDKVTIEIRD